MSKPKHLSSNGFSSSASGFSQTMKKEQSWKPNKQMMATQKDPILGKVAINVQQNQDRKRLIQSFLDRNANEDDLDLKTTMQNVHRPRTSVPVSRNDDPALRNDDPFKVRSFVKTQNLMVEADGPIAPAPPGVLHLREFNYGNPFSEVRKRKRDPIAMIQALVRGVLQRRKFRVLRKQFEITLKEHRTFTEGERAAVKPPQSKARLRPSSSSSRRSSEPTILQPVLKSDGLGIWAAMHRKQTGRRLSTASDQEVEVEAVVAPKPPPAIKPKKAPPSFWNKEQKAPEVKAVDRSKSSIAEEVYMEEDFEEASEIQEEFIPEDEGIQEDVIQESMIQSVIQESVIKESIGAIRESISGVRESIAKESIQEDYGDDFEEASNKKVTEEYAEEFDSYSDVQQKKKSVTFEESVQVSRAISPEPKPAQQRETLPIQYIKPKWEVDDQQSQVQARQEAEFILEKFRNRYKQLRSLEFDESAFGELEKEHYDFLRVRKDVDKLLEGADRLHKAIIPPTVGGGSADLLYSKFQFEFHRLMSVNALGSKLQNIITSIGAFANTDKPQNPGTAQAPGFNSIQRVLLSIEQQQVVVQQVLQQVLVQLNSLFVEQQTVSEIRLYRQEMDQKLQQLLFKQDKLLNGRLESQLAKRDEELKRYIRALFERQRKDFGSVKLLPSSKLQEALNRSLAQIAPPFAFESSVPAPTSVRKETQPKDDSSYQPDFEGASEFSVRQKSEESDTPLKDSMSVDREVNEYESFEDIEWQTDNNLFEKQMKPDQALKDRQTQELVELLTQMLLEEIKQDLFPAREKVEKAPVVVAVPKPKIEKKVEKKQEEAPKVAVEEPPKIKQAKPEIVDDFGMGGPSFSRSDLEKEFDLSGDVTSSEAPKEKLIAKELKVDPEYTSFVKGILEKYSKLLVKSTVVTRLLDLIESGDSLGGVLARDFHFFKEKDVREKDAHPIVQALEEQLCAQLLGTVNDYTSTMGRNRLESILTAKYAEALSQSQKAVLKITEKLIPIDYYPNNNLDFQEAYTYSNRNAVPKECINQFEVQEYQIQQETEAIGEELHDQMLMNILKEVMEEFTSIGKKRRQ